MRELPDSERNMWACQTKVSVLVFISLFSDLKGTSYVKSWREEPAIVVPRLVVAVPCLCGASVLIGFLAGVCRTLVFMVKTGPELQVWQLISPFFLSFSMAVSTASSWFVSKTWKTYKNVLYGFLGKMQKILSFGEESQCI